MTNDECDTDTMTLAEYGITLPQSPQDAWLMLYPYLPDRRTPWRFLKGILTSVWVALPIMVYLGLTAYLALVVYVMLGPVAALAFAGVGLVYGWSLASERLDILWRIDDETIREVNSRI